MLIAVQHTDCQRLQISILLHFGQKVLQQNRFLLRNFDRTSLTNFAPWPPRASFAPLPQAGPIASGLPDTRPEAAARAG